MRMPLVIVQALVLIGISTTTMPVPADAIQVVAPITEPVFMCGSGHPEHERQKSKIFESVPSRPLAVSADGALLFVINGPANCLEIFAVRDKHLALLSTVSVGIDPVAVAPRTDTELWVVNHLSDSVSIVDIAGRPRVVETLQVGDAPWDVVFGDSGVDGTGGAANRKNRAFISAAFRGQHHRQFKTQFLLQNRLDSHDGDRGEQIGRADLWVFDIPKDSGSRSLAGIINLFTDSLRSLAVSEDGSRVFATAFKSGNRTSIIPVRFDDLIGDRWSTDGVGHPEPMLVVQQDLDGQWHDLLGRDWSARLNFSVADDDFFVIAADAPLQIGTASEPRFNRNAITATVRDVGTTLFNVAYDATHHRVIISGMESHNIQPMEDRLKGRFVSNQLAIVDLAKPTPVVHKLLLDGAPFTTAGMPPGMALPGAVHVDAGNGEIVLASMGGNKLSSFKLELPAGGEPRVTELKQRFLGKPRAHSSTPAGGPIGMVADPQHQLLFVQTLFDNKVLVFDVARDALRKTDEYALFNPELPAISYGRQYLYDATLISGNGAVACASCHIFGGSDKLQWDLSEKDRPIEIVEIGYVVHPDRDIPDLRTDIRAIAFRQDPEKVKVGDLVPLGNLQVPVVYKGAKRGFADALASNHIDLKSPGLAYLEEGESDPRLQKYKRITTAPAWLLIDTPFFHPLKGPMRTLSLRGIATSGPLHFRGDVQGLTPGSTNHCPPGATREERALKEFNTPCDGSPGLFEGLLGGKRLSDRDMQALTQYVFALSYPPNPIRPLNNRANKEGEKIFTAQKIGADVTDFNKIVAKSPLIFRCVECHTLDRSTGQFGTSKEMYSAPALTLQDAKIPHLRFLYDRVGFFRGDYRNADAYIQRPGLRDRIKKTLYDNFGLFESDYAGLGHYLAVSPLSYYDEVITGTGFNHGAWFDTTMFATSAVWILNSEDPSRQTAETLARYVNLFEYLMEFDTDYFPMFGQQFTFRRADLDAIRSGGKHAATILQRFEAYVGSIYAPEEYSGVQCNLRYQSESAGAPVAIDGRQVVGSGGSSNKHLIDSLLSLSPDLEPITFTCS